MYVTGIIANIVLQVSYVLFSTGYILQFGSHFAHEGVYIIV